ncbi:glycoside hydrolase family 57 [Candidatus Atribacteria bacterium MT.SAG.1]|nr:glycoside hydrolase family 57 [Candidatus Atribacteria bacterium MT.SAG.1]
MLCLYLIFHLNLMYSSIEIEDRIKVIEKCYWPLLKLAEANEIPMGVELSGYTLEKIKEIDFEWIEKFRKLLEAEKIELVGSGYAQIIGPLVPAVVNDWNQKLGLEIYENILGIRPQIALVNEMAYSGGIVEHYINNNFDAIIMEWNNPRRYHPEWKNEWRYFPQYAVAVGASNRIIPLIWADSIVFQKFQRYAQGELELEEYIEYLKGHYNKDENRYFPVYANDVEIFDFRPNRYNTEIEIDKQGEWPRIEEFFNQIKQSNSFKFVKPSKVLLGLSEKNAGNKLKLESPEQPIPVKKQEKYNVNRWALTGRNDLYINTECYKIYNAFLRGNPEREDWKELCYLWSSDFRTHITDKRWRKYSSRLDKFKEKWDDREKVEFKSENQRLSPIKLPYKSKKFWFYENDKYLFLETKELKLSLNKYKGLTIDKLWFKNVCEKPLMGTLPHGYYDEISLGADFYSGHTIIEKPGEHKITDLSRVRPEVLSNGSMVIIKSEIRDRGVKFNKEYRIYLEESFLEIVSLVKLTHREIAIIHPMNITFIPTSFDKGNLFYASHNGGGEIEKFKIRGDVIEHGRSLSSLISAKQGLGATEGMVIIGDKEKQLCIWHDNNVAALIPTIYYQLAGNNQYFLRLQYSAQEMDETFVEDEKKQNLEFCWKIRGSL